jgi:hypothetical protein
LTLELFFFWASANFWHIKLKFWLHASFVTLHQKVIKRKNQSEIFICMKWFQVVQGDAKQNHILLVSKVLFIGTSVFVIFNRR